MRILRLVPELPLLRRELTELSARKRTYVVRSLGAMVLLAWVLWVSQNVLSDWQRQQQQPQAQSSAPWPNAAPAPGSFQR